MTKGGSTYYLTYDQVESLRVVADASGNVVKRIDYDSFGSIIDDTDPTFEVPFGFAGGDADLYGYCLNNPINLIDPDGQLAFFWHGGITYAAARNSGYGIKDSLKMAWHAMAVDIGSQGQNIEDTRQHAMAGKFPGTDIYQSSAQAIASTNAYIQESITSGNLAGAVHAAQDLATLKHAGQEWRGYTAAHILGDMFPSWSTIRRAYQDTKSILSSPCETAK
ncbi:MAG: hypothetical protein JRE65_11700 [Deltaproteobacteria bacterium]|nr:hypothetical protein [Deltaproteobacteria bacterium]